MNDSGGIGLDSLPVWLQEMMAAPSLMSQMQGRYDTQKARQAQGMPAAGPPQAGTPEAEEALNLAGAFDFTGPIGLGATIKAYHGSPHTFDRFDMSKIGTGEGAQVYGHGLYFAENPAVAKSYQDALSGRNQMVKVGDRVEHPGNLADELWDEVKDKPLTSDPENYTFGERSTAYKGWLDAFYDLSRGRLESPKEMDPLGDDYYAGYVAAHDSLTNKKATNEIGSTYTVDLDVNHDDLLDWDAPLSQQGRKIEDAMADLAVEHKLNVGDATGARLVKDLEAKLGSAGASQAIRSAGIPGIRYFDGGSRTGGEGTRNFVLFDDALAQIVERK